jgi:uncharacterized repeat protein (TIGR01451 family)
MTGLKKGVGIVTFLALLCSLYCVVPAPVAAASGAADPGSFSIWIQTEGDWQSLGRLDFSNYETREVALGNKSGAVQLKISQQGHNAAAVDYLALSQGSLTYAPLSALNLNSGVDVLVKVLAPEYDVCDAWNSTLLVAWDKAPANARLVMRAMQEDTGEGHGGPFYYPFIQAGKTLSYSLRNDGGITVDGILAESGQPNFSVFWQPDSPHPAGYTCGWLHDDGEYLYAAVEVTSDNTADQADWGSLFVNVKGKPREFRITSHDSQWGVRGFQYTSSVAYQHSIYEFKIPLSELNASSGDTLAYGIGCYGTVANNIDVRFKIVPPVAGSSITYAATTYHDGDTADNQSSEFFKTITAHPAPGYVFSFWQSTPSLFAEDPWAAKTRFGTGGDGVLIMYQAPAGSNQKWMQRPDVLDGGLDVLLKPDNATQLSEDFVCRETDNITGVTLWGSWSNDEEQEAFFTLEFWDMSGLVWSGHFTQGNSFGHFQESLFSSEKPIYPELLWDPDTTPDTNFYPYTYDLYQYDFSIDPSAAFHQEKGQVYYLVVKAEYYTNGGAHYLGLKNSLDHWNSSTQWTDTTDWSEYSDLTYPAWPENEFPYYQGDAVDLAFALYGDVTPPSPKWLQEPNTGSRGIDIFCPPGYSREMGDDFLCNQTGPITGASLWGSWLENEPADNTSFNLAIYSNIPASESGSFSMPGEELWSQHFSPGQYQASLYSTGVEALFWDPETDADTQDNTVWRYDFAIDPATAFIQSQGQVYWLVMSMDYGIQVAPQDDGGWEGPPNAFGWRGALKQWRASAVWSEEPDEWNELYVPQDENELDLALALYGQAGPAIGDRVWEDADRDGIQDPAEIGITGVTVNLYYDNDTLAATTTTLAGQYYFTGLPAGNYYLQFISPEGYLFVAPDQGADDALDSDASAITGRTAVFSYSGENDLTRDAGLYLPPGIKWLQKPDLTSEGMDVLARAEWSKGTILGDDFLCTATGDVTMVRVWGSWANDLVDPNAQFLLGFCGDIPATEDNFSRPEFSNVYYENFFGPAATGQAVVPGQYRAQLYSYSDELFFNHGVSSDPWRDNQVWQYDFYLGQDNFTQTAGTVYWLCLSSFDMITDHDCYFGWKTSTDHWNDDAVAIDFSGGPGASESELRYPPYSEYAGSSIDLAFGLYNAAPNVVDPKTVERVIDADQNGVTSPGDTLRYTCLIENTGDADAHDVMFNDDPDPNTTLVVGSVTTNPAVPPGNIYQGNSAGDISIVVNLGTIAAGDNATVSFDVRIKKPCYAAVVANQALVTGSNFSPISSDDPGTIASGDPTSLGLLPSSRGVGGQVESVSRLKILIPWIGLAIALVVAFFTGRRLTGKRHNN